MCRFIEACIILILILYAKAVLENAMQVLDLPPPRTMIPSPTLTFYYTYYHAEGADTEVLYQVAEVQGCDASLVSRHPPHLAT